RGADFGFHRVRRPVVLDIGDFRHRERDFDLGSEVRGHALYRRSQPSYTLGSRPDQAWRAGPVTTSPSRSSVTLIWQERRAVGRTSKAKSSMSSSIGEGLPVFSCQ